MSIGGHSTLCRRQRIVSVQIPYRRADGPLNLLVDIERGSATGSSEPTRGITFLGDGEWPARKHGVQGRRQWRKVHLAMDTATSDIRAVEFTSEPRWRQSGLARPAGPDPRGRRDWHGNRRRRL